MALPFFISRIRVNHPLGVIFSSKRVVSLEER
jgi:hypothetical protein